MNSSGCSTAWYPYAITLRPLWCHTGATLGIQGRCMMQIVSSDRQRETFGASLVPPRCLLVHPWCLPGIWSRGPFGLHFGPWRQLGTTLGSLGCHFLGPPGAHSWQLMRVAVEDLTLGAPLAYEDYFGINMVSSYAHEPQFSQTLHFVDTVSQMTPF